MTTPLLAQMNPLAHPLHTGTYYCKWQNIDYDQTIQLDIEKDLMVVRTKNRGSFAGKFTVKTLRDMTRYSLTVMQESVYVDILADGKPRIGTAKCTKYPL